METRFCKTCRFYLDLLDGAGETIGGVCALIFKTSGRPLVHEAGDVDEACDAFAEKKEEI